MTETTRTRKLIEVALPLDEINAACKADKDRKTGSIRNLHKWFAPMPTPAWRALLFAALIDDPGDDSKRVYLLDLMKRLVANGADLPDEDTLLEAQKLLQKHFPDGVPTVMDPFCGGGSTLVEAQRLGLPTYASDLNPVPVLITRTLTELLPKVHGQQPLHPDAVVEKRRGRRPSSQSSDVLFAPAEKARVYAGYHGVVRDLNYYAEQIRDEALKRLSDYYQPTGAQMPIAWMWARTAMCPNPACSIETLLSTSWSLSKKKGALAWIEPTVADQQVRLEVVTDQRSGAAPKPTKLGRGAFFTCLGCAALLDEDHLIDQGSLGKIGLRMTAVILEQNGRKVFREPTEADSSIAESVPDTPDFPHIPLPDIPRWFSGTRFGFNTQADQYTPRQRITLTILAELVANLHDGVVADGGTKEWADAITTLMGLTLGKAAGYASSQTRIAHGDGGSNRTIPVFGRHDMPMNWDFPEINLLGEDSANWMQVCETVSRAVLQAPTGVGTAVRADARVSSLPSGALIATDPPYFDAIGYADLSDYFYVWHRQALRKVHPDLYATVAAPKAGELTAIPAHHGKSKDVARQYFISGFTETFENLQRWLVPGLPMLVVYASKEQTAGRDEETRWSSILTAMVDANLEITGTWPIHGARGTRMIGLGTNAVASYIVMVCRPRPDGAPSISLADFNRALRRELPQAIHDLQAASILPVDLAQAAMGPGMQIYSRYRDVLDQSGSRVPVEHALRLINSAREAVLDEQEGELDPESRFAVRWWEAYGWEPSVFDDAAKTARPLGISVDDVARAQVVTSKGNKVQLLGFRDLDSKWVPSADIRATAWEAVHHLAHRLIDRGGELEAAQLMAVLGNLQDPAMALVYRLHDIAAKKGRTADQERYNALINSWAELIKLSSDMSTATEGLF